MSTRTIVWRLTDSYHDGKWYEVPAGKDLEVLVRTISGWKTVQVVTTGDLEWDGNRCAEVVVPAHRLELWLAEHRTDAAGDGDPTGHEQGGSK